MQTEVHRFPNNRYTYYVDENQKSKAERVDGSNKGTTNYTYDGLNRLIKKPDMNESGMGGISMKKIIVMIIIVTGVVIATTYIVVSFYRIEHAYSHDNKLLLTRKVQLQHNLDKYNESLELIMNQIFECYNQDKGRLYILNELPSSDALSIVMNECNVSYAQINREVDEVIFYQTALSSNNEVALSYVGTSEDNGETTWSITKKFPDFSRKETIGVKIYNFVFNRGVL